MNIFLSTSFSSKVLPDGSVEPAYRALIESVIEVFESKGDTVACGMREDGWRLNDKGPVDAFSYDVRAIDAADAVVAIMRNNPVSAGMELELGYAFAKGKPIILVSQTGDKPVPYINVGLLGQQGVRPYEYENASQLSALMHDVWKDLH